MRGVEELTLREWKVLRELKRKGRAHWTQLGLPKNVASSILSGLVKKGLVERIDQGFYQLTDEGEKILSQDCSPFLLVLIVTQIEHALETIERPSKELAEELVRKEVRKHCPLLYLEILEELRMRVLEQFLYGERKGFLDVLYERLERY